MKIFESLKNLWYVWDSFAKTASRWGLRYVLKGNEICPMTGLRIAAWNQLLINNHQNYILNGKTYFIFLLSHWYFLCNYNVYFYSISVCSFKLIDKNMKRKVYNASPACFYFVFSFLILSRNRYLWPRLFQGNIQ